MTRTRSSGGRDLILVHSSDLHVDDDRIAAQHNGDGTAGLRAALATARAFGAGVVLLAGDTFDNHMITAATIDRAGQLLADAGVPVVLLPGNHDPLTGDSVYRRGGFEQIAGLHILGLTDGEAVEFPEHGLEIWGRAHRDSSSRSPPLRPPREPTRRWFTWLPSWLTPTRRSSERNSTRNAAGT